MAERGDGAPMGVLLPRASKMTGYWGILRI